MLLRFSLRRHESAGILRSYDTFADVVMPDRAQFHDDSEARSTYLSRVRSTGRHYISRIVIALGPPYVVDMVITRLPSTKKYRYTTAICSKDLGTGLRPSPFALFASHANPIWVDGLKIGSGCAYRQVHQRHEGRLQIVTTHLGVEDNSYIGGNGTINVNGSGSLDRRRLLSNGNTESSEKRR